MSTAHTEKTQARRRAAATALTVAAGNALYALTVKLFLLPAELVTGGTTGLALTVERLTGLPISAFVLCFNVAMLALGFFLLGRSFALTTVASSFLYPLFLALFDRLLGDAALTEDTLLCVVFSGLGIGLALGLVLRAGASTGGMDIPPLLLHKWFRLPVSAGMVLFDGLILLSQAMFQPVERILYGILLVLIYTLVLDKMLLLGASRTEIKVVSRRAEEIRRVILSELDRGVTMLDGEGGWSSERTQLLLSVLSNRELPRVERRIREIDPECFLIVTRVAEVRGRGFSMGKAYR